MSRDVTEMRQVSNEPTVYVKQFFPSERCFRNPSNGVQRDLGAACARKRNYEYTTLANVGVHHTLFRFLARFAKSSKALSTKPAETN